MNRRLAGSDRILNIPARRDSRDEWQVWLVDEAEGHERTTAIVLHIWLPSEGAPHPGRTRRGVKRQS